MAESELREKHLDYADMQASRDVMRIFMYVKFAVALLGFGYIGYHVLAAQTAPAIGSGAMVFLSFVPAIILLSGLRDMAVVGFSRSVETAMRADDRAGRSGGFYLVLAGIFGVVFIHLALSGFLGPHYMRVALSGGPDGRNPLSLFMVFAPYLALAIWIISAWRRQAEDRKNAPDVPEGVEIAMAEARRKKVRLQILGVYAVTFVLGALILFFGLRL